jgi:hypothetical protein
MTDSSTKISPVCNYKTYSQVSGKYRYLKVPLNNFQGNQVLLDATTSQMLEFKVPVSVYNLSKSIIGYNTELAAGGAANANWSFADGGLEAAQSITFGSAGGFNLVDLNFANNYLHVARKIDTNINDFDTNDLTTGMAKSNTQATNFFPPTYTAESGNIYCIAAGVTNTAASANEPQYSVVTALNTKQEVSRQFLLGNISNTLFEMNRDLFLGDVMYLRIQTAPSSKVAYMGTAINDPAAGALVVATQPTLKNVYLYLAVEQDQIIKDSLMAKFAEGKLEFPMPFTYGFRNSTVGAGLNSVQLNLTSQYGRKLKRILHSVFPASETLNNSYNNSNWSGRCITSFQTAIDSIALQDGYLNCVQPSIANPNNVLDDYRENMKNLKRSAIQNSAAYQNNWFHIDSFCERSTDPDVPDSNIVDGLDLTLPRTWSISMNTTAANYSHYTWCSFVRICAVTASGPVFVA